MKNPLPRNEKGFPKKLRNLGFYQIVILSAITAVASFGVLQLLTNLFFKQQETTQNNINTTVSLTTRSSPATQAPLTNSPSASSSVIPLPSVVAASKPLDSGRTRFVYNVFGTNNFTSSQSLQVVINSVVKHCQTQKLPVNTLSVTLIDLQTGAMADYQGNVYRYPASVVKLFWLVAASQKISQGELQSSTIKSWMDLMILKSDNQGASKVMDAITGTVSSSESLEAKTLEEFKSRRQALNVFFRQAGYSQDINVSQKTFPIPQENIMEPKGFDQQLRGENIDQPIRNRITTNDAARLMYEIIDTKSVNPEVSIQMRRMLTRNVNPGFWKKQPPNPVDFNPVESFFGEGLPIDKTENIVSKAGWTSNSRQEVAFIKSKDGRTRYILAVFGDDVGYGKSKKIFPEIASLVYAKMRTVTTAK
jgi:beta-lactamase class A